MAQCNYEGDISNINEVQLQFINKVILEQGLKVNKLVFQPVGKAGDNFASSVKRITIESNKGNTKMILKIAPSIKFVRQVKNTEIQFKNEHIMYTEVLPKFLSLQKAAGVPQNEQIRFAKCYGSLTEQPNEVIVLEDLNESDYIMLDKFKSLSDDCVKSVLKNFAIFHSLSYVLQKQEPETFDEINGKLTSMLTVFLEKPDFMKIIQVMEADTLSLFDNDPRKSLLINKIGNIPQMRNKLLNDEDNEHSVILHGDGWTNNILFKMGEDSVQSVMIDYQGSNYGNTVVDLFYMIFNCTDHETRSKHYYDWINYYHSELANSLSNFGMDVTSIYPREQLNEDLKKYSILFFSLCVLASNLLMRDSTEARELMAAIGSTEMSKIVETMKSQRLQSKTYDRIKKRVVDLITSFQEFNYL
uniref:CHK kinase-like domain-containing protein n=1 Tax=Heliothis virescens TaxID=7102 RepID=A0A2A4JCW2_HELVI